MPIDENPILTCLSSTGRSKRLEIRLRQSPPQQARALAALFAKQQSSLFSFSLFLNSHTQLFFGGATISILLLEHFTCIWKKFRESTFKFPQSLRIVTFH